MEDRTIKTLVITSSVDETASYIIKKYGNTVDFFRVNIDRFNEYYFDVGDKGWSISNHDETITEGDTYSIYYRKPILPRLNIYDSEYHFMIQRDIISLINGLADSFKGRVLTKPSILRKTENKIFQLLYASRNGWKIPQSYIGNNREKCLNYEKTKSIIKPLTTGKVYGKKNIEIYQTNLFRGVGDDISFTPVYLQRYIPKQYEVRLTIIGKYIYTVRIDTQNQIDWRADYQNHKYTQIICPNYIMEKCYKMMTDFELSFGAFDFIVTPQNEWIFLEINPNGQWLWLENKLGLDISKGIVEYLTSK